MWTERVRKNGAALATFTLAFVACAPGSSTTVEPLLPDSAVAADAIAGGGNSTEGGAEANRAPAGNVALHDGAPGVVAEAGSPSHGQPQGQAPVDGSAVGSSEAGAPQTCGAGEQTALSSGLPAACATCLCSTCPKEFGVPTGMDDPAIAGDVEAGLELPGGSNAQGCDTGCWLFWSCMYMNGCAELNAFDVSGITNCLTSHCGSQYAAIGGKWPNDSDLCSVRNAKAGEQRACSSQCSGD